MATASAVVGDILDGALHKGRNAHITTWFYPPESVVAPHLEMPVKAMIRVSGRPEIESIARCFPRSTTETAPIVSESETAFIIGKEGHLTEKDLELGIKDVPGFIARMRIYSSD